MSKLKKFCLADACTQLLCLEGVCAELFYLALRNVCTVDLFGRSTCMYRIVFLVHVGICTTPRGYEVRPQTGGG